jgi:hypothetical protein
MHDRSSMGLSACAYHSISAEPLAPSRNGRQRMGMDFSLAEQLEHETRRKKHTHAFSWRATSCASSAVIAADRSARETFVRLSKQA